SHMTSNINNVAQIAAAEALNGTQQVVEDMRQAFDRRRGLIVAELSKVPGFICPTPEGAFYAYVDVQGALDRDINGVTPKTSLELADLILEQAEVAAVPGEAFGPSGYLRFSYALSDDALVEGIQRIQRLLS
ncbi:MAG TPA: aminotransferase class I/II-fold pyridoxal phosphate-dependent enzyme, partial [Microbacteriaceae bacterium]|nr:aminotransferase class I/II-fold pyridoxal phosphate-dependent enzyme [Microbacteriaceae bacterium]